MLAVEFTPSLLGMKVSGDCEALEELYDAVWKVCDPEESGLPEIESVVRTRMLSLCYDLRHAYQGMRNVERVGNGMIPEVAEWLGMPCLGDANVVYSVEVLYPELMFEVICLNELVDQYLARKLGKVNWSYLYAGDERALIDLTVARIRLFQGLVMEELERTVSKSMFGRIRKQVCSKYAGATRMYPQWIDIINVDWIAKTCKQRESGLSTVARDLASHRLHDDYAQMKAEIDEYMRSSGAKLGQVQLADDGYPDDYDWGYGDDGSGYQGMPSQDTGIKTQPIHSSKPVDPSKSSSWTPVVIPGSKGLVSREPIITDAKGDASRQAPSYSDDLVEGDEAFFRILESNSGSDDFDYEQYERQCAVRRSENTTYLNIFEESMAIAGLSEATRNKHLSNIEFYLNTYLLREDARSMPEGCFAIDDYLGYFFICKCMWSSPSAIKQNITSLKKFYKCMLDNDLVEREDYNYLLDEIAEMKDIWVDDCKRFDRGDENWHHFYREL